MVQDVNTLKTISTLQDSAQKKVPCESLEYIPRTCTLYTALGKNIYGWSTNTGFNKVCELADHKDAVRDLCLHRHLLASASSDCTVKLWNIEQAKCTATFVKHTKTISCLCSNGDVLFSASGYSGFGIKALSSCDIIVWDVQTAKPSRVMNGGYFGIHDMVYVSPCLYSTGSYGIRCWDNRRADSKPLWSYIPNVFYTHSMCVIVHQIFASSLDGYLVALDVRRGEELFRTEFGVEKKKVITMPVHCVNENQFVVCAVGSQLMYLDPNDGTIQFVQHLDSNVYSMISL
jgi:WD40 repeat protein